ncbi:hypothetical protein GCM10027610_118930 [Dactylosporangium cerinum]
MHCDTYASENGSWLGLLLAERDGVRAGTSGVLAGVGLADLAGGGDTGGRSGPESPRDRVQPDTRHPRLTIASTAAPVRMEHIVGRQSRWFTRRFRRCRTSSRGARRR